MPLDSETGDMKALTLEELAELGQQGVAMGLDKVNAYGVEVNPAACTHCTLGMFHTQPPTLENRTLCCCG